MRTSLFPQIFWKYLLRHLLGLRAITELLLFFALVLFWLVLDYITTQIPIIWPICYHWYLPKLCVPIVPYILKVLFVNVWKPSKVEGNVGRYLLLFQLKMFLQLIVIEIQFKNIVVFGEWTKVFKFVLIIFLCLTSW